MRLVSTDFETSWPNGFETVFFYYFYTKRMIVEVMVRDCSRCGSSNTIKYGSRDTRNGSKPVFYCNNCGSKFVEPGFKGKS